MRTLQRILITLFALLVVLTPVQTQAKKSKIKHQLAVCAIFQNEARFIKEWIEFHKLMGATHFFLYNNESTDEYFQILKPYILKGEVDLINWPYTYETVAEWTSIQAAAYMNAVKRAQAARVKWLAILDTDEFIFPTRQPNLIEYLADFEDVGGIVAHWQLFGTNNVEKVTEDRLMIELLTKKAPDDYPENAFVKSIVRPDRVSNIVDPHYAIYKKPYFAVGENWNGVHGSMNPYIIVDKIRINHYWSRDNKYFKEQKMERRQKWLEGADGQIQRLNNINVVDDFAIQRFVPTLRNRMNLPPLSAYGPQ